MTTMTTTTAAITTKQIRTLRTEATAAGDYAQVDLCNRALTKDGETTDQDGNAIALADMTQADAMAECARAIADAAAQGDAAGRARYRAVVGDVTATRATVVRLLADWTDSASIEPWQALVSSEASMAVGERVHLYAGRIARQSRVGADPSVAYLD